MAEACGVKLKYVVVYGSPISPRALSDSVFTESPIVTAAHYRVAHEREVYRSAPEWLRRLYSFGVALPSQQQPFAERNARDNLREIGQPFFVNRGLFGDTWPKTESPPYLKEDHPSSITAPAQSHPIVIPKARAFASLLQITLTSSVCIATRVRGPWRRP